MKSCAKVKGLTGRFFHPSLTETPAKPPIQPAPDAADAARVRMHNELHSFNISHKN
jgi:hypothetical protein